MSDCSAASAQDIASNRPSGDRAGSRLPGFPTAPNSGPSASIQVNLDAKSSDDWNITTPSATENWGVEGSKPEPSSCSTIGTADPVARSRSAENGCAMSVPSRTKNKWFDQYATLLNTWSRTGADVLESSAPA